MKELDKNILEYLWEHCEKCGDHCGVTMPKIYIDLDVDLTELKDSLNRMYKVKQIVVREGIHGKLMFYDYDTDALGRAKQAT